MKPPHWLKASVAGAMVVPLVVVVSATPSAAQPPVEFTAQALTPSEHLSVAKAPTSRLARTDKSLLDRGERAAVPVLVKLDHDAVATYRGEVAGYPATSPTVTGRELVGSSSERRYEAYLARREAEFVSLLAKAVPAASVRQRLRTVYGGLALTVPANQIEDVLALDGVVAVQADEEWEILTDSSPAFIGADSLYPHLGGDADAGKGTIIGVLDTGGWPEHPSFADHGNLDPPPGPARECDYGPDPTSDDDTPFECNNKLIGGAAFLETYHEQRGDELFPFTARDGNGHGTHVAATAAGNALAEAPVFGVDHGPINGVAPGAWVIHYRVCGTETCFASDSAAGVAQAVADGVDVVNFSIGGGADPYTDPLSLAFLDAYAAGVLVAASAGNAGPGAATTNHVAPWVTTVAASTQAREFGTTLTLTAATGETLMLAGTSITSGVTEPAPVVLAESEPYQDSLCLEPAPAGSLTGLIVACQRGENARTLKGHNVRQGGAVGMILYNPVLMDTGSDNHHLPTIHLADGAELVEFLTEHPEVHGSFPDAERRVGQADVMASFSSRGPGGFGLKPDVSAPGVQILAGDVPIAGDPDSGGGPAGELFQAIGGTSMASPHVAGAALLLTALHPDWSPAQIKSALMSTAWQDVVKEDLTTPADPFDYGSGRIDLAAAGSSGLTFDETVENMVTFGGSPLTAIHLNLASINAPVMPGRVTTTRTVANVTGRTQLYRVQADSPPHSRITVDPSQFSIGAGKTRKLRITITSSASEGQHFGEIRLVPQRGGLPTQHLPVGFVPQQGDVTVTSTCLPSEIKWLGASTCTVIARNKLFRPATVDLRSTTGLGLVVSGADGATVTHPFGVAATGVELDPALPTVPSLAPGNNPAGGWLPMSQFTTPISIGDEAALNFTVPQFVYGGQVYDRIGVVDNGYLVVGGATEADIASEPPGIPNPAPPNNILAPFWTDLDGSNAPGVRVAVLSDGVNQWAVVEWELNPWGVRDDLQRFQVWIGLNGAEDVSFAYDPAKLPASPWPLEVGAENADGSEGDSLGLGVAPDRDQVVTSSDPEPGGSYSYTVRVIGAVPGNHQVTSLMDSDAVLGTTVVTSSVQVKSLIGRR